MSRQAKDYSTSVIIFGVIVVAALFAPEWLAPGLRILAICAGVVMLLFSAAVVATSKRDKDQDDARRDT